MYRKTIMTMLAASFTACAALAAQAEKAPPAGDLTATLLEKFGDQGIDANADGVLTTDEVELFFQKAPLAGPRHGRGGPGQRGPGRGFGRGSGRFQLDGQGPHGDGLGMFKRLEVLSSETPPAQFDLRKFPNADANGDGQLSNAEWVAFAGAAREKLIDRIVEHHPEADTNGDGDLDDAELAVLKSAALDKVEERVLENHPEADTDGDGALSEAELEAFHQAIGSKFGQRILQRHPEADTDGDGVLSREEMRSFHEENAPRFRGKGPGRGGPGGPKGPRGPGNNQDPEV